MKMVYKLLLVFTCIVLLTLCACGGQTPTPPNEGQTDAPLSQGELDQIGESAVEKWATIGYIVSEPLYNTALSQLGQNELREIYSAHIYASGLDSSLAREDEQAMFWMDLSGSRVSTLDLTSPVRKTICRRAASLAMKSSFILTAVSMLRRPSGINMS